MKERGRVGKDRERGKEKEVGGVGEVGRCGTGFAWVMTDAPACLTGTNRNKKHAQRYGQHTFSASLLHVFRRALKRSRLV